MAKSAPQVLKPNVSSRTNSTNLTNKKNDHDRIYPDLSKAPSPFTAPDIPDAPGSPISVKDEPLTQEKLASIPQLSHPSQEPTPPLSSVDIDVDVDVELNGNVDTYTSHAEDIVAAETETTNREFETFAEPEPEPEPQSKVIKSEAKRERKHVFPGGNYRMDLPMRTNTLTIESLHKPDPEPTLNPKSNSSDKATSDAESKAERNNAKLKRRRSSRDKDEDEGFFASYPPTPDILESEPSSRQSKTTLRLVEGPFGSEFVQGKSKPLPRDSLSSEEDDGKEEEEEVEVADLATQGLEWPPRNKNKKKAERTQDQEHHPFSQPTQLQVQLKTVVKQEPDDYAEASTSHGLHPFEVPQNHDRHAKQHRSRAHMDLKAFVDSLAEPTRSRSRSQSIPYAESDQSNTEPHKPYVPSEELIAALTTVQSDTQSSTSNAAQNQRAARASGSRIPAARPFTFPQPHDRSVASPNDPFLVPAMPRAVSDLKGKQKMQLDSLDYDKDKDRRKTFGSVDSRPGIPDIDLAERLNKPHRRIFSLPRHSLPAPLTSTSATVYHSLPSRRVSAPIGPTSPSFSSPLMNMSPSDAELAMRLGRAAIIQLISENRRFTEDTIMRVWQQEGSFERADARLKEMWEAAEGVFEARSARNVSVAPARHERMRDDNDAPTRAKSAHGGTEAPERSRRATRQRHAPPQAAGLVYTPVPAENGHVSDYSPPQVSRAAQFRHPRRSVDERLRSGVSSSDITPQRGGFSYMPSTSSPLMRSQSPEPPSSDGFRMVVRPVTPATTRDVWGIEEEHMLRSGDAETLQRLEARVGKMQYRRRMAESFRALP